MRHTRSRPGLLVLCVVVLASLGCAEDVPAPRQSGVSSPTPGPAFVVRLDSESSDLADFRLAEDDDGIRIQTGPAGIAYRDTDVVLSGDMRIAATFTLFDAPVGYREAYGIFVGGIDLDGPDLEYTYLLVRPSGDYLVKRRIGTITETLVDWTPHPSVQPVRAEGDRPQNTLGVEVFEGETHFLVNGDIVHVADASRVRPYGIAGVRVNHRLDVRVDRWLVEGEATRP